MTTLFTAQHTPLRRRLTTLMMLALLVIGFTSQATMASAESTSVGPFSDGCYYIWNGAQYTARQCPHTDGSVNVYMPANGTWAYSGNVMIDASGVRYVTTVDGTYAVTYPDGSKFIMRADRVYGVFATDGQTLMHSGYVDANDTLVTTAYRDASGTWVTVGTTTTATGSGTPLSEESQTWLYENITKKQNEMVDVWLAPACTSSINGCD